jgi:hypothetical protein
VCFVVRKTILEHERVILTTQYLASAKNTDTPCIATTSDGGGMDSALEYMLSGARGLLWPRPIIPGT